MHSKKRFGEELRIWCKGGKGGSIKNMVQLSDIVWPETIKYDRMYYAAMKHFARLKFQRKTFSKKKKPKKVEIHEDVESSGARLAANSQTSDHQLPVEIRHIDLRTLIKLEQHVTHDIRILELPMKIKKIGQGAFSSVYAFTMENKSFTAGKKLNIDLFNVTKENACVLQNAVITLMRISKKQYAATFRKQSHSLSERYQLAENIKTTRFIMPITAINSVCPLFGVILTLVYYSLENPPQIVNFMMNLVFCSLLPCYGILYPLVSAYGHQALRNQIKRKYFFCWKSASVSPADCELRNPIVKSLIIDSEKEGELHFAGLQSAWN